MSWAEDAHEIYWLQLLCVKNEVYDLYARMKDCVRGGGGGG
jgi:hypothetical protein